MATYDVQVYINYQVTQNITVTGVDSVEEAKKLALEEAAKTAMIESCLSSEEPIKPYAVQVVEQLEEQ